MQGFYYKDAKSMEERANQELEKARKVAEEKEARLVALRAMGDRASQPRRCTISEGPLQGRLRLGGWS